ncbi:tyrosine--tRNA ligase 1, cytoplasmic-like protein [Tanacetum coccineum]
MGSLVLASMLALKKLSDLDFFFQDKQDIEHIDLTTDKIFYACMRCADINFIKVDICQLGMDQRNMSFIARKLCDDSKPIILLHYMLPGLLKGQEKMPKSDASSAVFMDNNEVC